MPSASNTKFLLELRLISELCSFPLFFCPTLNWYHSASTVVAGCSIFLTGLISSWYASFYELFMWLIYCGFVIACHFNHLSEWGWVFHILGQETEEQWDAMSFPRCVLKQKVKSQRYHPLLWVLHLFYIFACVSIFSIPFVVCAFQYFVKPCLNSLNVSCDK